LEQSVERELAGETEVLGENLAQVPLCEPQISHYMAWAETQATAVGTQ
jgi:hypothetical protein